jgi:hypothetical protein
MKYLITFLFLIIALSSFAQKGRFKPSYIGWPVDSTRYGVLAMDTTNYVGEWLSLNTTDFEVSGGELRLRFQTDSVFVQGDSLCAITMGDTICVYQDSVYITADSFCIIQMGDTTCVEFTPGVGETTLYNGDGSLLTNRTVSLNNKSLTFDQGGISGKMYFNQIGIFPFLTIDGEVIANNTSSLFQLVHSGSGDMFMNFNGAAAEDYAFGVDKSADALVIAEGTDVDGAGDQMMVFYSTGDSIVSVEDHQFDAGILDASGDIGSSGQVLTSTGTGTNWETATGGAAISDLTPATATNTINNDGWEQEWQWDGLLGGAGLKLTSTNTGAIGSTQKLFSVSTTGVNATPGQTTYAAHFSNSHTGSSHLNYGVYSTITGANSNSSAIYGTSSSLGTAVSGVATSGYGIYGTSSGNTAIYGAATTGTLDYYGVKAEKTTSNTSSLQYPLGIYTYSSGTPAAGFGGGIAFYNEPATGGTAQIANRIESEWTDATTATRTSRATITGVNSASTIDLLTLNASGRSEFNTTVKFKAYTVGTLPTGTIGDMAYVTDASAPTYLATVSGGGAVVCPVFYNGTNWVAH